VSVYQPEGVSLSRVASSGPVTAPESSGDIDLERFGSKQDRETFALGSGAVVVEGGDPAHRPAIADLTSFASSLVVLASRAGRAGERAAEPARFETVARYRELLGRALDDAARHGRRVSAVCVALSDPLGAMRRPPSKLKEELRALTRPGDALGRDE